MGKRFFVIRCPVPRKSDLENIAATRLCLFIFLRRPAPGMVLVYDVLSTDLKEKLRGCVPPDSRGLDHILALE